MSVSANTFRFFFCCMSADFGDLKILLPSERLPASVNEESKMSCESVSRNASERLRFSVALSSDHVSEMSMPFNDALSFPMIAKTRVSTNKLINDTSIMWQTIAIYDRKCILEKH